MFTVLVIASSPSIVQPVQVKHFKIRARAQAWASAQVGVGCSVECFIFPGRLSLDQAVSELLD